MKETETKREKRWRKENKRDVEKKNKGNKREKQKTCIHVLAKLPNSTPYL